jgi:hypothetical protein
MTAPSKRDVENKIERLKQQTGDDTPAESVAFETADGGYCDVDGKPIEDWSTVVFIVPYELWRGEWVENGFTELTPPE